MENAFIKKEKVRFQHVDYAGIVFYPRFLEMLNCLVEDYYGTGFIYSCICIKEDR